MRKLMNSLVFLEKLAQNPESLKNQFSRSFELLSIAEDFDKSRAIFIKPNLTYPLYKPGVTTRKEFVESLVASLRNINSTTKIYIGEGEGGYNSFSMSEAFENMGFMQLEKEYPNVRIVNLSRMPSKEIAISTDCGPYKVSLPEFFDEIDFSISCPLPKVHCMTKISLSYKNQWGCLPDVMRLKNHYMFDHVISKISDILKFKYAFLDGKYGLDDNGPMVGTPVELDWFAASNSLGAFDVIVSEMMGFDWQKVGHLKMASKYGFIPEKENIEVIGDIELLKTKFKLNRTFWNYPALAAFKSKNLTHFFYFSKYAGLVHDIMYTFRKRPIDK